jgi:hypothetical protein
VRGFLMLRTFNHAFSNYTHKKMTTLSPKKAFVAALSPLIGTACSALLATAPAQATQTANSASIAKPTHHSYIQSGAAYSACRAYQSRNTWVGGLVNARNLGWGMFGCDFTKVCLRVNQWGQQAANFPVTRSAGKLETGRTN